MKDNIHSLYKIIMKYLEMKLLKKDFILNIAKITLEPENFFSDQLYLSIDIF